MIISVLQNELRSISSFLSANFTDFTHEKAENCRFLGVLQNEWKLFWPVFPCFYPFYARLFQIKMPFLQNEPRTALL